MISCWSYRDAWHPFLRLLDKFWPDHPRPVTLLTDQIEPGFEFEASHPVQVYCGPTSQRWAWCTVLANFMTTCGDGPVLLFQEDFFLTSPVNVDLIEHAIEQMHAKSAGSVRLYPCPGAERDDGDPFYGVIPRGTPYRISLQATIWRPSFLEAIARQFDTAIEFELRGGPYADLYLGDEVLSFKRHMQPWPLEYLCTAIVQGEWSRDAKRFCELHEIPVDWSRRRFQSA